MRLLARFAWPVTTLGLVVILGAVLIYLGKDQDLERHARSQLRQAEAIALERMQITLWPGVLVSAIVTGLGLVLLEVPCCGTTHARSNEGTVK